MVMAEGMDTGDILSQRATPIPIEENAAQLFERLAQMGAELLVETVARIGAGTVTPVPQDESKSSHAPMLSRELSPMNWEKTARQLHDQVRGLYPWPAATAVVDGVRSLSILKTSLFRFDSIISQLKADCQYKPGRGSRNDGPRAPVF